MAEPTKDTIIEEREDLMVSPKGGKPSLKNAHFLKPTVTSIDGSTLKPPSLSLSSECKPPLKAAFIGWQAPQKDWKTWVDRMHSTYQSIWRKAGIYEAILASTFQNRKNTDLIFRLAEFWCSETNTFIFPWGEATVTLEDMMILGGFSVLGDSVSRPLKTQEFFQIQANLIETQRQIRRKTGNANHYDWLKENRESRNEFEHEAFLALWLSRFVIPHSYLQISKYAFPIAIHLARGTRIALAPVVLASLYSDLRLLKKTINASAKMKACGYKDDVFPLTLFAPFHLVQIWAWERLPQLQPKPNFICSGEPRLARWHKVKTVKPKNMSLAINSARESFQWRPYAMALDNWSHKFYKEKEIWVSVDSGSGNAAESFARCLRVSELVGIGCIEQYLPHRVAMQFGMDQDLPGYVPRSNTTRELAWNNYNRPIRDEKLYIPSQLFEPNVTTRYLEWWKQSQFALQDPIQVVIPHGLPPKCERVEADKERQVGMLQTNKKHNGDEKQEKPLPARQFHGLSSSITKGGDFKTTGQLMKPIEQKIQTQEVVKGRSEKATEHGHGCTAWNSVNNAVLITNNEGDRCSSLAVEVPELALEARVTKLERVVARLKAAKLSKGIVKNPNKDQFN